MWVRLSACLVWAILALSAVYWTFKLLVRPEGLPPHALLVTTDQAARGDPLRLFSTPVVVAAAPVVPEASSRFKLLGVMAPKGAASAPPVAGSGLALIAVDGKPARAFPVGAKVDGEWVLQAVSARSASLGPVGGAAAARLEVPALPSAATGTLPAVPGDAVQRTGDPVPAAARPAVSPPVPSGAIPPPRPGLPAPPPGSRPGVKGEPVFQ